jgi:hypothetical protein
VAPMKSPGRCLIFMNVNAAKEIYQLAREAAFRGRVTLGKLTMVREDSARHCKTDGSFAGA